MRHWLAFYDVHANRLWGYVRPRKRARDILDLPKRMRRRYPARQRIHPILDNLSAHGTRTWAWHPRGDARVAWLGTQR